MKENIICTIQTKEAISVNTDVNYTPKLVKKLFDGKKINLVMQIKGMPHTIGTVSKIKIVKESDDVTVSGIVKSSIDFNMENKELKFCFMHNASVLKDKMKYKDFKLLCFYIIDSKIENLLTAVKKEGLVITSLDKEQVMNSHLTFEDLFKNRKTI